MTSAAFTSLSAPVLEDTMELSSSPAGNQFDGDIDIDLGDYPNLTDDERMLDDGEPMRPATGTDDMMDDDDTTLPTAVNEEVMHDGPDNYAPDFADEELIDYDDDQYQEHSEIPALDATQAAPAEIQITEETVDDEVPISLEHPLEEAGTSANDEAPAEPSPQAEVPTHADSAEAQTEAVTEEQGTGEVPAEDPADVHPAEDSHEGVEADEDVAQDEDGASKPAPQLPGTLDTNLGHVSEGPSTPTDTGLHPMTLKFGDHEMPLFKSRAQPNGLLKDDNLANVSLADLIHNCKQRLSLKLGEASVPDGQDLVLNFDRMGMMVFEGSRSASSTSLNDVFEIYFALHQNDGVDDVPPLLLSLNPQPFSSLLDAFKLAAAEGTGMSHFLPSTDHEHAAQHDEAEQAIYDEVEYDQNGGEGGENHDIYDQEDETANYQFDLGDEQDGNQEAHGENDQGEEREYDGAENTEETYEDNSAFQQEKYPGPEDDLSQYDDEVYQEEAPGVEQEHADEAAGLDEPNEAVLSKSAASSETVREDLANDHTGEYDQNFIDYDDDSDLTGSTEAYNREAEEEFLAFLDEDGDADAKDGSADNLELEQQANAQPEEVPEVDVPPEDGVNEDYQDAEDGNDLTANPELNYDHGGEDFLEFIEDEDDEGGQTDNQEEIDQNEDTEQFHTALDLIDGTNGSYDDNAAGGTGEAPNGEEFLAEDDIGFEYEDGENDDNATGAAGSTNSPLGKRSFEEHADEDDFGLDEPDLKKSRSD